MNKTITTKLKIALGTVAIFTFALVFFAFPKATLAGDYYGLDTNYDFGGGWYNEITPNYYQAEDSWYNEITPNYYSYDTFSGGGYSAPSYGYQYNPVSIGGGGGYSSYPMYTYAYNTPTGSAGSSNTNTNVNTITNTNNNDARINVVVLGGGSGSNTNTQSLTGNCVISPSTAYVNQDVTFSASASGGNGSYTYSWTGDNGINSSSQSFTGRFSYTGVKNATVTIRSSDGQSITRTCSTNVQDNYNYPVNNAYCVATPSVAGINQTVTWTVYPGVGYNSGYNNYGYTYNWSGTDGLSGYGQTISRVYNTPGYKTATVTMYGNGQTTVANCATTIGALGGVSNVTVLRDQTLGTPVAGVFLNQVPDTGISFGLKMTLFALGLIFWSIFGAYMLSRKTKLASANGATATGSNGSNILSRIEAFKRANLAKKGHVK